MWNWCNQRRRNRPCWQLLEEAHKAGLPACDYQNAKGFFEEGEDEVGFDIIVQQLYEYELEIPETLVVLAKQIAESMLLPRSSYFFLQDLVRSIDHIPVPVPVPVKQRLASLIASLQRLP